MKIGYARVSTREQTEGNSLEQQIARLEKAGASLIFSDVESGRSNKRKQFNKMLSFCKKEDVSEVIVTRVDRLGRSVVTIHNTMKLFEELDIKLNVMDAPVDQDSAFGWFSINQMAGLAEFESRLLQDRIKHGFDYFREQGKASPQPPFGFKRLNEKYAFDDSLYGEINKTKHDIALEIIEYFLSNPNATLRNTMKWIYDNYQKKFTPAGLKSWLTNPVLVGNTAYNIRKNLSNPENWIVKQNTHEGLISQKQMQLIKQKLQDNVNKYAYGNNKIGEVTPLRGLVYCGACGYCCHVKRRKTRDKKKTWVVLRCKKREEIRAVCDNKNSIRLTKVIEIVDKLLLERYEQIAENVISTKAEEEDRKVDPREKELRIQLTSLQQLPRTEIIQKAIDETLEKIEALNVAGVFTESLESRRELLIECFKNPKYWALLQPSVKAEIYKKFVDKIFVLNGEVTEIKLLV